MRHAALCYSGGAGRRYIDATVPTRLSGVRAVTPTRSWSLGRHWAPLMCVRACALVVVPYHSPVRYVYGAARPWARLVAERWVSAGYQKRYVFYLNNAISNCRTLAQLAPLAFRTGHRPMHRPEDKSMCRNSRQTRNDRGSLAPRNAVPVLFLVDGTPWPSRSRPRRETKRAATPTHAATDRG